MSRRSRQVQQQIGFLAVIISTAIAGFYLYPSHHQTITSKAAVITAPSWYIIDADDTTYDNSGLIKSRSLAQKATYYDHNETTDIIQPVLHSYSLGAKESTTTADHGLIDNNKITTLTDNVILTSFDKAQAPSTLKTQYLVIDTKTNQADTDAPVRIIQGTSITHAVGMHADFNTDLVSLHSGVNTVYAP